MSLPPPGVPPERWAALDTPSQIDVFRLFSMKYALQIEMRTGLRHSRGSVRKLVNKTMGWNCKTKEQAYRKLDAHIAEVTKHLTEDPA